MFKYHCLNPIAKVGLDGFTEEYVKTEDIGEADGILVRSASMHDIFWRWPGPEQASIISLWINVHPRVLSFSILPERMPMA